MIKVLLKLTRDAHLSLNIHVTISSVIQTCIQLHIQCSKVEVYRLKGDLYMYEMHLMFLELIKDICKNAYNYRQSLLYRFVPKNCTTK